MLDSVLGVLGVAGDKRQTHAPTTKSIPGIFCEFHRLCEGDWESLTGSGDPGSSMASHTSKHIKFAKES